MTRTERSHDDRALAFEAHHIRVAAAAEALALGHPEVDVEHLLLGLLVVGGPSARALTDAGADLHGVRRAMAEVTEHDLSTLGVTAPAQHAAVHTGDRIAALAVPEARFETVAAQLNDLPQVAHNYRREHPWNMWFVLACASAAELAQALSRIEALTGLAVLNLPKEHTYHVGLYFPV